MIHAHKWFTRRLMRILLLSLVLPLPPTANAQAPSHVPPKPSVGAARTVALTDSSNGHSVTLHPGDTLIVRLSAHTDGGYTWHVVWAASQDLLTLQSDTYTSPHLKPGMVSGSGTRTFRFTVRPTGLSDAELAEWLRFLELRPFEKGIAGSILFQIHVIVIHAFRPPMRQGHSSRAGRCSAWTACVKAICASSGTEKRLRA